MTVSSARPLCFQDMVLALQEYWRDQNCVLLQSYDAPVGAGTFHPETALRALGAAAWRGAYIQPCRRPTDGRYGDNPNRLQHYYQYQVFLKPSPENSQSLYLESLAALGVHAGEHDIRFIEDDWESPTLGAAGLGWEVWCDGMEVSQFTYFQQMGGIDCHPSGTEITYGLERLAMYVQEVEDVYALRYSDSVSYGDIFREAERQYSHFHFEHADTGQFWHSFETAVSETGRLLAEGLVRPAWDSCLSASHDFNCLDARGAISTSERQRLIARIRNAARSCCEAWLEAEQAGKNSQS